MFFLREFKPLTPARSAVAYPPCIVLYLKTKIEANRFDKIKSWVKVAVEAAEMIYTGSRGEEKKIFVLNYLNSKGYTLDTESINNLIESAVLELKSK